MMKSWKFNYFEKNIKESHFYIFKSLEIKRYLQKFFKNHKYFLHNYRFNFSKSNAHLHISVYRHIIDEKRRSKKKKLLKKKESHNPETQFLEKLLESVTFFTKTKLNIIITLQNVQHNQNEKSVKNIKLKLQRFKKTNFFNAGIDALLTFATTKNSEKLLTTFISQELQATKRHNFFLFFLKESLNILLNQKFSKILGIKLLIKGRLNNASRSKYKKITIGKISLIQTNSKLISSEATAYTNKNGTIGVKAWVLTKENT